MTEERSVKEREYEEALREAGFAISEEHPDHKTGNKTVYMVVGKKPETDHEYEVFGDSRENALKALLALAKAR